jgi:hypothetical protein
MNKTTLYLDGDAYRRLKRIAADRKVAPAALVREAVAEYVTRHGRSRPMPKSLGAGDSGTTDLGERSERLLAGIGTARTRPHRDRR